MFQHIVYSLANRQGLFAYVCNLIISLTACSIMHEQRCWFIMMVPTTLFKPVRSSSHEQSVQHAWTSLWTTMFRLASSTMLKPVNNHVQAGQLNHVQACQTCSGWPAQPCLSLWTTMLFKLASSTMFKPVNNHVQAGQFNHVQPGQQPCSGWPAQPCSSLSTTMFRLASLTMFKSVNNHVQAGSLNHVQACQQAKTSCAFLRV